jgi:hypothetical protein
LIDQSASGTALQWLFGIGFLGYKTKLGLLIFTALVIVHTIQILPGDCLTIYYLFSPRGSG